MRSDGRPLPDLGETAVLHRLGLITSDRLPDVAARWLAADLHDTPAVRVLAGHHPHDPWGLDELLRDALDEAHVEPPREPTAVASIAVDWVAGEWRRDRDTRGAVATLARLGAERDDLALDAFIGLDDEWRGGWGRLVPELEEAAAAELEAGASEG